MLVVTSVLTLGVLGDSSISSERVIAIGNAFVQKAGLIDLRFEKLYRSSRSRLLHLVYKGTGEAWSVRIAPDGEVFSAESTRLYPLVRNGNKSQMTHAGRLVATSKALAIAKRFAGNRELTGGATSQTAVTYKFGMKVDGYPVHGYGCTLVFDPYGSLLEYGGKWNAPSTRVTPAVIVPADQLLGKLATKADVKEVKWFDLGDGKLTLAWRIRLGRREVIFDAGSGKKLIENVYR